MARQQLGLEYLVGIEDIVVDLDTGLAGELLEHAGLDVVGPVVHVEDLVLLGRRAGCRRGGTLTRGRRLGTSATACQHHAQTQCTQNVFHRLPLYNIQTFSSRCSRSHELITCRNTSYSASFTIVNADTNGSPSSFTRGCDSRSLRSASSKDRGSPKGR